jgi:hypothetical protein
MAYIGQEPANSFISFEKQVFTIVNSQTAYTLSHSVVNENDIRLVVNNVVQEPGSGKAYTASGTTLTLSAALVNGTDEMYCVYLGRALQTVNAPDGSISNSQVAPTIITGQTAETSIATDDTILIHDTSAGALRKMTRANFVSGVGGTNTPAFQAYRTALQSISNNTWTKIQYNVELFDTDGAYDHSTNYRFTIPSGAAGKYVILNAINLHDLEDTKYVQSAIYKNGSKLKEDIVSASRTIPTSVKTLTIDDASVGDYYEAYIKNRNDSTRDLNYIYGNVFYAYKILT